MKKIITIITITSIIITIFFFIIQIRVTPKKESNKKETIEDVYNIKYDNGKVSTIIGFKLSLIKNKLSGAYSKDSKKILTDTLKYTEIYFHNLFENRSKEEIQEANKILEDSVRELNVFEINLLQKGAKDKFAATSDTEIIKIIEIKKKLDKKILQLKVNNKIINDFIEKSKQLQNYRIEIKFIKEYYTNGILESEIYYDNYKIVGTAKWYYQSGMISIQEDYISPKDEHYIRTKWFENGLLEERNEYKNGLWHGKHLKFYENGKKFLEANYVNGTGKCITWHENGKKLGEYYFIRCAQDGKQQEWYSNGNLQYIEIYDKGKKVETVGFHENGSTSLHWRYKNSQQHGQQFMWHDNGKKFIEENWYDGKLNGKKIVWYSNGQINSISNYIDGFQDGKEIRYFENGRKAAEIELKLGKKNGKWVSWDISGKVRIEYYENDKQVLKKSN